MNVKNIECTKIRTEKNVHVSEAGVRYTCVLGHECEFKCLLNDLCQSSWLPSMFMSSLRLSELPVSHSSVSHRQNLRLLMNLRSSGRLLRRTRVQALRTFPLPPL